jgi:hypothetical protein
MALEVLANCALSHGPKLLQNRSSNIASNFFPDRQHSLKVRRLLFARHNRNFDLFETRFLQPAM